MIRILSNARLQAIQDEATDLKRRCRQLNDSNQVMADEVRELEAYLQNTQHDLEVLKEENKRLLETSTEGDRNEVIMRIDDDMTTITPIVRWKGDSTSEKLIEMGYLKDANNTKTATQVALMVVALESLEQLVEEFQPNVQED